MAFSAPQTDFMQPSTRRASGTEVLVRTEIGFDEELMRRLVEGTPDFGLIYTPRYGPGLRVEDLFDQRPALVSTAAQAPWPDPGYVHIDRGPAFHAAYANLYPDLPDLEPAARTANIGWLGGQPIPGRRGRASCRSAWCAS